MGKNVKKNNTFRRKITQYPSVCIIKHQCQKYRAGNLLGGLCNIRSLGSLIATVLSIHLLQVLSILCLVCVLIRRPKRNELDKSSLVDVQANSLSDQPDAQTICLFELSLFYLFSLGLF